MEEELKPCPFCGGTNIEGWARFVYCETCRAQIDYSEDQRRHAPKAWNRRADGWIAVSERLPEDTKPVLISDDAAADHVGYYSGTDWWQRNGMVQINARYWQPLPAAPKAGDA